MQHFADFGIVKQSNKSLKQMYESKTGGTHPNNLANPTSLGKLSDMTAKTTRQYPNEADWVKDDAQELLTRGKRDRRTLRTREVDPLTRPLNTVNDYKTEMLNPKLDKIDGFSEVRANNDPIYKYGSGYTGFRTDPFKGYGGMMEEEVPLDLFQKTSKTPLRHVSRLSGKSIEVKNPKPTYI